MPRGGADSPEHAFHDLEGWPVSRDDRQRQRKLDALMEKIGPHLDAIEDACRAFDERVYALRQALHREHGESWKQMGLEVAPLEAPLAPSYRLRDVVSGAVNPFPRGRRLLERVMRRAAWMSRKARERVTDAQGGASNAELGDGMPPLPTRLDEAEMDAWADAFHARRPEESAFVDKLMRRLGEIDP